MNINFLVNIEKENALVVQHNDLIEASYSLTLQEKRIILWLCSQVKKEDKEFNNHEMKISDFCDLIRVNCKSMHSEIEQVVKELMQKVLTIKKEKSLMLVSWLSYAEYFYNEGRIVLRFDPALKPYLLELKERFTITNLFQLLQFKSFYSIRMYELLSQYISIGKRDLNPNEIKDFLGIHKNKYSTYANLKLRVIDTAIKEINEKSEIQVSFKEERKGRKIVSLNFQVSQKQIASFENTLVERAIKFNILEEELQNLLKDFTLEHISKALSVLENYKGKIKNPKLFLKKALAEYWQPFSKEEIILKDPIDLENSIKNLSESKECKLIRKAFIKHKGEAEYCAWLKEADMAIDEKTLRISVKNAFIADWIQTNYGHLLKDLGKTIESIVISVNQHQQAKEEQKKIEIIDKNLISPKERIKKQSKKRIPKIETTKPEEMLPSAKQLSFLKRIKMFFSK